MCSSILKQILWSRDCNIQSYLYGHVSLKCKWLVSNHHNMALLCQNGKYSISKRYHQTCKCVLGGFLYIEISIYTYASIYIYLVTKFVMKSQSSFEDSNEVHNIRYNLNEWNYSSQTDKDETSTCADQYVYNFYYYYHQFSIFIIKCVSKVCLQTACLDINNFTLIIFDILNSLGLYFK